MDGFPPKSELVTAFVEHGVGETEPECESGKPGYWIPKNGGGSGRGERVDVTSILFDDSWIILSLYLCIITKLDY